MNTNYSRNPKRTALAAVLSLLVLGGQGLSQPAHAGGKDKSPESRYDKHDKDKHDDDNIPVCPSPGPSAVPEPGSLALMGVGALGLVGPALRARKRRIAR